MRGIGKRASEAVDVNWCHCDFLYFRSSLRCQLVGTIIFDDDLFIMSKWGDKESKVWLVHLLITEFHWCFSWIHVVGQMHVVGQRGTCLSCIACIQTSCTYWHSHQEISPCTLNRLESQWKTFPLNGLWTGGIVISWCAFFWCGAGSFNVVSAPPLHNWHWNFHWSSPSSSWSC